MSDAESVELETAVIQNRLSVPASQEKPLLFVISPWLRVHDKKALRCNKDWRWMSWRSLLLAYDRALDPHHDDDEFRQFRRTREFAREPDPICSRLTARDLPESGRSDACVHAAR